MLSAWDRKEDRLQQSQEKAFGEQFAYVPRLARANKTPITDPSRAVIDDFPGVFMRPFTSDNFNPSALSTKGLKFTDLAQRSPAVEVRASVFPYEIKQGDIVVRKSNGVRYEVTVPKADGHGTITIKLNEVGISEHAP